MADCSKQFHWLVSANQREILELIPEERVSLISTLAEKSRVLTVLKFSPDWEQFNRQEKGGKLARMSGWLNGDSHSGQEEGIDQIPYLG